MSVTTEAPPVSTRDALHYLGFDLKDIPASAISVHVHANDTNQLAYLLRLLEGPVDVDMPRGDFGFSWVTFYGAASGLRVSVSAERRLVAERAVPVASPWTPLPEVAGVLAAAGITL